MKNKKLWIGIVVLMISSLVLSACQPANGSDDDQPIPTRLTMGFIPNIQFAPVYVAIEKGYFTDAGFAVELEYGNEADAVALVGAGDQTFAIASGEQILLAREQGLPVTYVAAWFQEYPVGVVSFSGAGIQSPEDLAGATVGIPGLFGASYIGFIALLNAGGLTEDDVTMLSIGFNQVEALVTRQVEAGVIYLANEPVVLRSKGHPVDVLRVADYMQLVSNGLVTNEAAIRENPEMVSAFIEALLKGIEDTIEDPREAYEISRNYVENLEPYETSVQREVLVESIKLWRTDRIGYSDPSGWANMQQVLMDMGLISEIQDLEGAFTNDLLP